MRLSTLFLFAAICCPWQIVAQLDCENAQILTGEDIIIVGAIEGEALIPDCTEFENGNAAMWYSYESTEEVIITVSSNRPISSNVDTRLSVLAGSCEDLICVGGNDDISGGESNSSFSFTTQPGVIYYIVWDNQWTDVGFEFIVTTTEIEPDGLTFLPITAPGAGANKLAAVDMNGDHLDDIVAINNNIEISYQQEDGSFVTEVVGSGPFVNSPTWSMAAADYDQNGYTDLLFGGGNGASLVRANATGNEYEEMPFEIYIFSQRTNFVDFENDGDLDIFVCHDVAPNVYFTNDGSNNFTTTQGGIGDTPTGGNYGSIFTDYDNDGDQDLFLAKCRGGGPSDANTNQIFRNNGDGSFTDVSIETNLADPVQTWSSAWGDLDNDGDMDAFVGASSFSNGPHKLMQNENGVFTDITAGSGWDEIGSTSIETITHDMDNDGYLDLLNSVTLLNNGDMTFSRITTPTSQGPVGDLNNDGFLDFVLGNTMYLNQPNGNHYLVVNPVGTVSHIDGIGARVKVYSALGAQMREIRSGDGFRYMSTMNAHFGLGQDEVIDSVVVTWPSGIVDIIINPAIDESLVVVEGSMPNSQREIEVEQMSLFPNPAQEWVQLEEAPDFDHGIDVYDQQGRWIFTAFPNAGRIPVYWLPPGHYVLSGRQGGKLFVGRMIKN